MKRKKKPFARGLKRSEINIRSSELWGGYSPVKRVSAQGGFNTFVDIDDNHYKMRVILTATHRSPKLPLKQDPMESFRQYCRGELFVSLVQHLGIVRGKSTVSEVWALVRQKEYYLPSKHAAKLDKCFQKNLK
jgi:hypothetical protein